ncbi:hypothetical protein V5799_018474 [Amblyomma americanum]|uniref:Uncharacterized protein n=1 Tax=Amblyomma americanum TaxID=6943 RepID=A0AAQ4EZD6_AMBAM
MRPRISEKRHFGASCYRPSSGPLLHETGSCIAARRLDHYERIAELAYCEAYLSAPSRPLQAGNLQEDVVQRKNAFFSVK